MAQCPKCTQDNPSGMYYCGVCGSPLALLCPQCGAEIPPGFKFCGHCAASVASPNLSTDVLTLARLQSIMPEELVAKAKTGEMRSGERRQVTVLFADVSGFTAMSERLDPEDVTAIMEECFQCIAECIYEYEGTIDKFLGDGVMAIFGAPIAHEDDPQRALRASLEILEAIQKVNSHTNPKWGITLGMHIGLNTGIVVAGDVGSPGYREYTVMGDTVNLASRLEEAAEVGTVLVSEATYRQTSRAFDFDALEPMRVKGKQDLVRPYRLLGLKRHALSEGVGYFVPLVGREAEFALLKHLVSRVEGGRGQAVSIVGEAGVGKSRLVMELRSYLGGRKLPVLTCNGLSFGGKALYLPFINLFRSLGDVLDTDPPAVARQKLNDRIVEIDPCLEEIVPYLADLLTRGTAEAEEVLAAETRKRLIQRAIRQFLISYAQKQPLALIIEDLHWVDPACLEALSALVEGIGNVPMLVCVTHRPDFSPGWSKKSFYTQLGLGPLSREDSMRIIDSFLLPNSLAIPFKEQIAIKAEGNCFFIEEALRSLIDAGDIGQQDGQWVATREIAGVEIPDAVQGIIMARIDRLDEKKKWILQCASVIGESFSLSLLKQIVDMEDIENDLARLEQLEIVYETASPVGKASLRGIPSAMEYRFKTTRTREVIYNSMLMRRRKELHSLVGIAIERHYENQRQPYPLLLHHFRVAEDWDKTVRYSLLAGDEAASVYALGESITLYSEAAGLLKGRVGMEREYGETLSKMAALHLTRGNGDDALQEYTGALRIAIEADDRSKIAELHRRIGHICAIQHRFAESASHLESASQLLRNEDLELSSVFMCRAWLHWHQSQPQEALACGREALALASRGQDSKRMIDALDVIANICYLTGDTELRRESIQKSLSLSRQMGDFVKAFWGLWNLAFVYQDEGSYGAALESLADALNLAEGMGFTSGMVNARRGIGEILYLRGEWSQALQELEKAVSLSESVVDLERAATEPGWMLWLQGLISTGQGRWDEGVARLEKGLVSAQASSIKRHLQIWLLIGLGRNYMAQGLYEDAQHYLEQALGQQKDDQCVRCGSKLYPVLAELYLAIGDRQKGEYFGNEALSLCRKTGYKLGEGIARRALARTWALMGRSEDSLEQFERAMEIFGISGMKPELAETLYHLGYFYQTGGNVQDSIRAKDCWKTAKEIFVAIGAEKDVQKIPLS